MKLVGSNLIAARKGTVLIIVLWIALGLVTLTLYFAHSMSLELRAADNRVAGLEAEQAIAGAARYVCYLLANAQTARLDTATSSAALLSSQQRPQGARAINQSWFWLLKPAAVEGRIDQPEFGLVDEGSKLNLNTATSEMLEALPQMTPNLAGAIIDWRDVDDNATTNGAESEVYERLRPPYSCKNAPFESVDELRLVSGFTAALLEGEDLNRNGVLDPNENDGDLSPPTDNRDGQLDRGLLAYLTVFTRDSTIREDGTARISVNGTNPDELRSLLEEKFGSERAATIVGRVTGGNRNSLVQFFLDSGMTADEFAEVHNDLSITNAAQEGLININSAPQEVLEAIPGIGIEQAPVVIAYRQSHASELTSVAWITEALEREQAIAAGPYITTASYQFTADIAAVGHQGRGYRRVQFVIDDTNENPQIIYRRDLTDLGWALGRQIRTTLMAAHHHPNTLR